MQCTKISAEFEFGGQWVIAPWVRIPNNVAFGYDVGKISVSCLAFLFIYFIAHDDVDEIAYFTVR